MKNTGTLPNAGGKSPFRKEGDESPQAIYVVGTPYSFVRNASETEVSAKGFGAGVPRLCEGTVGGAPSEREE